MPQIIPISPNRTDAGPNWLRCVELQRMYASFGDDHEFFVEMIGLFRQSSQECLSQFEKAIDSQNADDLHVASVGFAGLVSAYSDNLAREFSEAAQVLETGDTGCASDLLLRMRTAAEDLLHDLAILHPDNPVAVNAPSVKSVVKANWRQLARSASEFHRALATL